MLRRNVRQLSSVFGSLTIPPIQNEPMNDFGPGSKERECLKAALADMDRQDPVDIPCIINGKEYRPGNPIAREIPSDIHGKPIALYHNADVALLKDAIAAARNAAKSWGAAAPEHRIAVALKAAHLISTKYRYHFGAATMIGQSKSAWQAEIDAVAETCDFLRYNAKFAAEMYNNQPRSPSAAGSWNRLDYRPLEGFVLSISPFNFTAIGANLAFAPALMGNAVLWKPSPGSIYANYLTMKIFEEAGMPPGVINFVPALPQDVSSTVTADPDLASVVFTGSTKVFRDISRQVGCNMDGYKNFPRVTGETGGKNFHLIHASADIKVAAALTLRAAFELQGQKCSACSRVYVPRSKAKEFKDALLAQHGEITMGPPQTLSNFMCALVDRAAYNKVTGYIEIARKSDCCKIIAGGNYSDKVGYFVEPTIIETTDPKTTTMREEIFGPVLTLFVYDDSSKESYDAVLDLINSTTVYALTGAVLSNDRYFIDRATDRLRYAAGNYYVNDKSTGAVVGMQPFGGARASGTNDKPGSAQFLDRFVSLRTIKESFDATDKLRYPHQD